MATSPNPTEKGRLMRDNEPWIYEYPAIEIRLAPTGYALPTAVARQILASLLDHMNNTSISDDPCGHSLGALEASRITIGLDEERVAQAKRMYPEITGEPVAIWDSGISMGTFRMYLISEGDGSLEWIGE